MSVLGEMKRRKAFHVVAVYAVYERRTGQNARRRGRLERQRE